MQPEHETRVSKPKFATWAWNSKINSQRYVFRKLFGHFLEILEKDIGGLHVHCSWTIDFIFKPKLLQSTCQWTRLTYAIYYCNAFIEFLFGLKLDITQVNIYLSTFNTRSHLVESYIYRESRKTWAPPFIFICICAPLL